MYLNVQMILYCQLKFNVNNCKDEILKNLSIFQSSKFIQKIQLREHALTEAKAEFPEGVNDTLSCGPHCKP